MAASDSRASKKDRAPRAAAAQDPTRRRTPDAAPPRPAAPRSRRKDIEDDLASLTSLIDTLERERKTAPRRAPAARDADSDKAKAPDPEALLAKLPADPSIRRRIALRLGDAIAQITAHQRALGAVPLGEESRARQPVLTPALRSIKDAGTKPETRTKPETGAKPEAGTKPEAAAPASRPADPEAPNSSVPLASTIARMERELAKLNAQHEAAAAVPMPAAPAPKAAAKQADKPKAEAKADVDPLTLALAELDKVGRPASPDKAAGSAKPKRREAEPRPAAPPARERAREAQQGLADIRDGIARLDAGRTPAATADRDGAGAERNAGDTTIGLQKAIQTMADRLERAEAQGKDTSRQVDQAFARLSARLDTLAPSTAEIGNLQRGISDILHQIDRTRSLSEEAAEAAAARAVRATLATLHQKPDPRIDRLTDEVAGLRDSTDNVHRTANEAIAGLRDVVRRLAARDGEPAVAPHLPPTPQLPGTVERARAAAQRASAEIRAGATVAPVLKTGGQRPADERGRFIAAARRSLAEDGAHQPQAPAAEDIVPEPTLRERREEELAAISTSGARRPILIGIAATLVLFGSWQAARVLLDDPAPQTIAQAPEPAKVATAQARPSGSTATVPVRTVPTGPAPAIAALPEPPAATGTAEATTTPEADPVSTGSIPPEQPAASSTPRTPDALPAEIGGALLRNRALAGDAAAQYEVGVRYADGRGVTRDAAKAADWLEHAAEQGLAPAQYRLGNLYEKGNGVSKDTAKALAWYEKAAEAGNIRAMHNIGVLYAEGGFGTVDYSKGALWFRKAADHGVRDSQYNLAVLYARGLGVSQNLSEAFLWFSQAAQQGDADAGVKRDQVAAKLSQQALVTARLASGTWQVKKPDEAANSVAPPPGGWDGSGATAEQRTPIPAARPNTLTR